MLLLLSSAQSVSCGLTTSAPVDTIDSRWKMGMVMIMVKILLIKICIFYFMKFNHEKIWTKPILLGTKVQNLKVKE